jgi:hypothetical protein
MKTLRILLVTVVCWISQSGVGNSQSFVDRIEKMVTAHVSLDSVYNFLNPERNISSSDPDVIRRKIDGGHRQLVGSYYQNKSAYHLLVQSDSNGIYLAVVNRINEKINVFSKNKFFYTSAPGLNRFISLHDSIYHSALTPEDFKHFVLNRYGRACGYAGSPTEKFSIMMQLMKKSDIQSLRWWLKSPDYETKVIAARGIANIRTLQMP